MILCQSELLNGQWCNTSRKTSLLPFDLNLETKIKGLQNTVYKQHNGDSDSWVQVKEQKCNFSVSCGAVNGLLPGNSCLEIRVYIIKI